MAKFNNTVITKKGVEVINNVINSDDTITFTCYKITDTKYNISTLENLVDIDAKSIVNINSIEKTDFNTVQIKGVLSNNNLAEGYFIETIGLYAKNDSGEEFLYSTTTAVVADFLPAHEGINVCDIYIDVNIKVGNSDNVTIERNLDGVVYQTEFALLKDDVNTIKIDIDAINIRIDELENQVSTVSTNVETGINNLEGKVNKNIVDIEDINNRLSLETETRIDEIDEINRKVNLIDAPIRNIMINSSFSQNISGFTTSISKSGANTITDMYSYYSASATSLKFSKTTHSGYKGYFLQVNSVAAKANNVSYIEVKSDIPLEYEGCEYTVSFVAKRVSGQGELFIEVADASQTFTQKVVLTDELTKYNFKVDNILNYRTDFTALSKNRIYFRIYFANEDISSPAGATFQIGQLQIVPKHQDYKYYPKSLELDEQEIDRYYMVFPKGYHRSIRRYIKDCYVYIPTNKIRGTCIFRNFNDSQGYLYKIINEATNPAENYEPYFDWTNKTTTTEASGLLSFVISVSPEDAPLNSTFYVPNISTAYIELV